jgi:hypothetical protein
LEIPLGGAEKTFKFQMTVELTKLQPLSLSLSRVPSFVAIYFSLSSYRGGEMEAQKAKREREKPAICGGMTFCNERTLQEFSA